MMARYTGVVLRPSIVGQFYRMLSKGHSALQRDAWNFPERMNMFRSPASRRGAIAGLWCWVFLAVLGGFASAQQFAPATPANAKQFVGVWKAEFHGNPFVTVTIGFEGDKLVGSVSHADVEVGKDGELTKAEPGDGSDPITAANVKGDVLRITFGSDEAIRSELRLVAKDEATLRMLVPPDVPAPKPWHLQRVAAKP